LVAKYGLDLVLEGMEKALAYSRKHLQTMLAEVPDGVGYAEDLLDDDGFSTDRHHRVCVRVEKRGDRLIVECAGTDPQALGPINMSVASSKGAIFAAVLSLIDPFLPLTEAILDLVEVRLPEGTLVNPHHPAPVAAFYCVMTRVSESLVRAMAALRPDLAVAGSYGDLQNTTGWGYHPETREEFIWYLFHCGGCGARATKDGLTGTRHMLANSRSESMEVWEKRYPVFYERLEVIRDSGGPGKYRGGLGMLRIFRLLSDTFITMNSDRNVIPAPGVFGGQPGMTNRLTVIREGVERTVRERFDLPSPSKFTNIFLRKGDLLAFRLGGGGGYGDPLERAIDKVERDVLNGWVSIERARDDYGVVVDLETGKADRQRTADLRARFRREGRADH
jgi:N-methylhydantoinase B/oxoprolinase/acetone carboxylase alpha subunit